MSEYKKLENAKAELKATVDTEKWKEAQKKAFRKLAKNVTVKGFRKGAAPENLIRKQIPEGQILLEAAESLAQGELEAAVAEHKVELIDRPELRIDAIDPEQLVLTFECPVKPDVQIEDYKDLGYKEDRVRVTEKEIQAEIDKVRENKAELELKEGAVENGDVAVIDYEGFIDGVAFEGGKGENHELEIGSGSFIPGFEEQLIGMNSEEEKEIKVTFPKDYHADELAGKEATFKVTVHEVKTKVLPEIDETIIEELNIPEVTNLEELKKYIKNGLTQQRKREAETKARNELYDKLNEKAVIEVPEVMIKQELDGMVNEYERQFTYQMNSAPGFKFDEKFRDTLRVQLRDEAVKRVRLSLILEEIGRRENIEVTDAELDAEYNRLAEQYKMEVAEVKRMLPAEFLTSDLRDQKTLEVLKGTKTKKASKKEEETETETE
ncbi:MAG: trigger factor [Erysipelotrichaceae bacterium]|nr:trigger factor [Erysipelotrichaceae bacterium]